MTEKKASAAKPKTETKSSDSGLGKRVKNLERAVEMLLDPSGMNREDHVVAIRKLVTTGETPEDTAAARDKAIREHAGESGDTVTKVG